MQPPGPWAVTAEHVHLVRGRTRILHDVSCAIPAGRCTAIIGPNGSGKTTLTRTFTGQMYVSAGQITVLGQRIGQTDIRALRQRIAVVNPTTTTASDHVSGAVVDAELAAQEVVLTGFFGTIGLYARPTAAQQQRAATLLDEVGLADRKQLRFAQLSSGEQRRCLIARALALRPDLIILDEPAAGLDLAGREQLLATIEKLLGRCDPPTVLLISHHVEELSRRTDLVLLMRDGRITHAGRPELIITSKLLTSTFGCNVTVTRSNGRYWTQVKPQAWGQLDSQDPDPPAAPAPARQAGSGR